MSIERYEWDPGQLMEQAGTYKSEVDDHFRLREWQQRDGEFIAVDGSVMREVPEL